MHVQKPEEVVGAARPFTGAQYLESLRDGREVYIYGERVEDVTTHPAFRNSALDCASLRCFARSPDQRASRISDRYRLRWLYPQILPCRSLARRCRRPA